MMDAPRMLEEVSDERLKELLTLLRDREGFCNHAVMVDEVRSMAAELLRLRARQLHCPGCDGDNL